VLQIAYPGALTIPAAAIVLLASLDLNKFMKEQTEHSAARLRSAGWRTATARY
jgi:hypothetical protein